MSIYWQLPPLLIIISLVYSATRHDDWPSIFREAFRWGYRMFGFLIVIGLLLFGLASIGTVGWVPVLTVGGVLLLIGLVVYGVAFYWKK